MWGEDDPDMQLTDDERRNVSQILRSSNTRGNPKQGRWFIILSAATIASFGGIMFGYDIGIISGALLQLRCEFKLSCHQQEMIVATLVIGALVSSLFGGWILDKYGRKLTIILNSIIFFVGAIILASAHSFSMFIIGRFVLGFSIALSAVADCVYISEIAPLKWRGLLVSMNEMGIAIGILISYLMNYILIAVPNGWRYMFIISAVPAFLQFFGMFYLPESPRWLVNKDKDNQALEIIKILWPNTDATQELDHLKNSISSEKNYKLYHLLTKRENLNTRFLIGCGIVFFLQLSGQPSVIYYAPILLQNLGYDGNDAATLATIGLGVMKVIFTFVTLITVDKLGRRTFLLIGASIITLSLVTLSGLTISLNDFEKSGCHKVIGTHRLHSHLLKAEDQCSMFLNVSDVCNVNHKKFDSSKFSNCSLANDLSKVSREIPKSVKYSSLISLMMFIIGFSVGYGPISWLMLSEIYPTGIKGRAIGAVSSVSWGVNLFISMTFLDSLNMIGPFGIFLIYAMIGILSIFFICQFVPETRGKSLELLSVELSQTDISCRLVPCCMNRGNVLVEDEWQLLSNNNDQGFAETME